jgi:hypothetical protein
MSIAPAAACCCAAAAPAPAAAVEHTHTLPACGKLTCIRIGSTLTVGCTACPYTNTLSLEGVSHVRVHIGLEGIGWTCLVMYGDQRFTFTDTPASVHRLSWFPVSYVTLLKELGGLKWDSSRTEHSDTRDPMMWFNSTTIFTNPAAVHTAEVVKHDKWCPTGNGVSTCCQGSNCENCTSCCFEGCTYCDEHPESSGF